MNRSGVIPAIAKTTGGDIVEGQKAAWVEADVAVEVTGGRVVEHGTARFDTQRTMDIDQGAGIGTQRTGGIQSSHRRVEAKRHAARYHRLTGVGVLILEVNETIATKVAIRAKDRP